MRRLPIAVLILAFASAARAQTGAYVVQSGDTLAEIARRHHVSVASLEDMNRVHATGLQPGDRLLIPRRSTNGHNVPARHYRVREGDTLARIARRNHTTPEEVSVANGLHSERIHPGDSLWIPLPGHSGAEIRLRTREGNPAVVPDGQPALDEEEAAATQARARELGLGPTSVGQRLLREAPDPRWVAAAGNAEDTVGTLASPVPDPHVLRGWGSGMGGYHLALDLHAPEGTEVHAAERGIVAYEGHGIRGYGNFVILVHPNGWVTAYAHHRQNLVMPGQLVERGQVIAMSGDTGYADGPHLHFMLVHNGEHCDPLSLFRPRPVGRNGEELDWLELVWETEHRPSGIRCLHRDEAPHPLREYRDWWHRQHDRGRR
jgi:murein DD-endopeptidase MepM/ murein hydrolase activator NlpD